MEIVSFAQYGYEGEIVKIEADLRRGIPAIDIVGLPDGAVKEARERMRAAIRNSSLEFPKDRILLNLSPADLKKEGSSFDLSIALAVLATANGYIEQNKGSIMVLGELELCGSVRSVKGVIAAVSKGLECGISDFIVPLANKKEASIHTHAKIHGVQTLTEAFHVLGLLKTIPLKNATDSQEKTRTKNSLSFEPRWTDSQKNLDSYTNLEDVRSQKQLIRAMVIAAAGAHNLCAYGPPGTGKTLALSCFQSLLPDLDLITAEETTRIHSIAGIIEESNVDSVLIQRPPFRMPNQNTSLEGMIGGGSRLKPGEVSLAHGGVLFLDEASQFKSSVLQALRSPIETGSVIISRAGKTSRFPAKFQLLLAINPCPCGSAGVEGKVCTCSPDSIDAYWKRLSAPLLDRIDLRVEVSSPKSTDVCTKKEFSISELRKNISDARKTQCMRNSLETEKYFYLNAHLSPQDLIRVCEMTSSTQKRFQKGLESQGLSGRGAHSILKIARTICDLEGSNLITGEAIDEALMFRKWSICVPDFL